MLKHEIKPKKAGSSEKALVPFLVVLEFRIMLYRGTIFSYLMFMSETAVPVAEAAKDFLRLLDWVESNRESAIIMREGQPVATLSPMSSTALTCAELADRWPNIHRLSQEEASDFADDLEQAHINLPALKPAWD